MEDNSIAKGQESFSSFDCDTNVSNVSCNSSMPCNFPKSFQDWKMLSKLTASFSLYVLAQQADVEVTEMCPAIT